MDMGSLEVPMREIAEDMPLPSNPPSYPLLSMQFLRRHGRDLFSCATSWFLLDIVFYSSNLFQSKIYHKYIQDDVTAYREAFEVARLQAIVAVCSTIPGYLAAVYFIDIIGRVKIQKMGFFLMAMVYFAIGIPYKSYWDSEKHTNVGFMFLYGLTFFFANFGPNTTTFMVPAELFPTRFRTTCHGISGAVGKVGAIIGSVGFLWASENRKKDVLHPGKPSRPDPDRMTAALLILGGVCIVGMLVTHFFTRETMGRSLDENENEDEGSETEFLRVNSSSSQTHSSLPADDNIAAAPS